MKKTSQDVFDEFGNAKNEGRIVDCKNWNLRGSNLSGANLSDANLSGANLRGAKSGQAE